jgi:hypothetical protein
MILIDPLLFRPASYTKIPEHNSPVSETGGYQLVVVRAPDHVVAAHVVNASLRGR